MAGRMGGAQRTTANLLVHRIDTALNLIYVRGAVPGVDDAYVSIKDAVRKTKWVSEKRMMQGKPPSEWLDQGVTSLPMPAGTVEQVKQAGWPEVVEWTASTIRST